MAEKIESATVAYVYIRESTANGRRKMRKIVGMRYTRADGKSEEMKTGGRRLLCEEHVGML